MSSELTESVYFHLNRFAGINSVSDGISGSVAYAAPALVSNTWFPPNQRATATAMGTFFVFMGIGMSFILGEDLPMGT